MDRKKIAYKNISFSFLLKILNMGIVYLTIPFLLKFLGDTSYGIWVTIFSVINIIFFIDGGIINGLKTKLTQAISSNDIKQARIYISSSYLIISGISFVFLLLGVIGIKFTNLSNLLNTFSVPENDLKGVFLICLFFIVFNFILSIYKSLFYSIQKVAFVELAMFIYQVIVFGSVYYVYENFSSSIVTIAYIYGLANLVVGVFFTILFFSKRLQLLPSIRLMKLSNLNGMFKLSIEFFLIQLSMIVIYTSDNILISNVLGPEYVARFDVVFKLFQVIITISVLLMEPFWPLFSDAYEKREIKWIRNIFNKYNKLFILFIAGVFIFSTLINPILSLWVGEIYKVDLTFLVIMSFFVIIRVYPVLYMYFLNGIGNMKRQVILYVLGAILNIPISIFLVNHFNLGIKGIVLGTIISIFLMTILLPIKSYAILKSND